MKRLQWEKREYSDGHWVLEAEFPDYGHAKIYIPIFEPDIVALLIEGQGGYGYHYFNLDCTLIRSAKRAAKRWLNNHKDEIKNRKGE